MPPAMPPDRKSQKNEKAPVSTGSYECEGETSEDELPMVQALEEQPTATTTKNGVSQPTGFASSFAKNLERTAQNGSASIKPNPKFLKKKGQDPVPKTGKPQKSKTPEKQAVAAELVKKNAERKPINKLIEAIKNLAQDQHVDNQKIESRVEKS